MALALATFGEEGADLKRAEEGEWRKFDRIGDVHALPDVPAIAAAYHLRGMRTQAVIAPDRMGPGNRGVVERERANPKVGRDVPLGLRIAGGAEEDLMVGLAEEHVRPVVSELCRCSVGGADRRWQVGPKVTSEGALNAPDAMEDAMQRRNLEIPKTALVLKAAPLAALILLLCGVIAHTILHPSVVVASVPTLTPATHQASAP